MCMQLPSVESPRSEHGGFRYEATGQIYSSPSQGLTLASHMKDSQPNLLDSITEEGMAVPGDIFYDEESEGLLVEEGEEDMMAAGEEHCRTSSRGSITSDEQKQGWCMELEGVLIFEVVPTSLLHTCICGL